MLSNKQVVFHRYEVRGEDSSYERFSHMSHPTQTEFDLQPGAETSVTLLHFLDSTASWCAFFPDS